VSKTFREMIERSLNHVEDFLLDHSGFVADADDQIAFR